ncbi:MAG TPA: zinc ABC transporter substrate-binding protein, partial [Spirochaetota bacterium]|nr:zinc ABC transporter substrate-binding protein [Spirochaetota bacterium]
KVYNEKLDILDKKYKETIDKCEIKTIMYGGHFAFGYMAKRYGLKHISPYEGFSSNAEPSPQKIAELIEKIKDNNIEYLFFEELLEPKVANTISKVTGVKLEMLHAAHNISKDELSKNITFIDIMESNLIKLKKGLRYK